MADISYLNAVTALEARVYNATIPHIDSVDYQQAPFTIPNGEPWVRLTTQILSGGNVQAGGGWSRQTGLFIIDIFYPITGANRNNNAETLDYLRVLFNQQRFDNVNCEDAIPNVVGKEETTGLFHTQVLTNFYIEGA